MILSTKVSLMYVFAQPLQQRVTQGQFVNQITAGLNLELSFYTGCPTKSPLSK